MIESAECFECGDAVSVTDGADWDNSIDLCYECLLKDRNRLQTVSRDLAVLLRRFCHTYAHSELSGRALTLLKHSGLAGKVTRSARGRAAR